MIIFTQLWKSFNFPENYPSQTRFLSQFASQRVSSTSYSTVSSEKSFTSHFLLRSKAARNCIKIISSSRVCSSFPRVLLSHFLLPESMPSKAKNNVNKSGKQKRRYIKKNTKISLCHLQFYIRAENRSSIYFL